jgi:hypothetical protein
MAFTKTDAKNSTLCRVTQEVLIDGKKDYRKSRETVPLMNMFYFQK